MTLVEYGDFECPYCGQAEPVVRELLRDFGDVALRLAAPAAERRPPARAAGGGGGRGGREQGAFWEMHDLLLEHQDALSAADLVGYAEQLGLDVERFEDDLRSAHRAPRASPRTSTPPT